MKICMPVDQLNGLNSGIFPSFRAAPALLVIDNISSECLGISAASGACSAMPKHVDTIVCAGGIGRGMFNGLRRRGARVFITNANTVGQALAELGAGNLEELTEVASCGGGHNDHKAAHTDEHDHDCGCGSQQEGGGSCCGHH